MPRRPEQLARALREIVAQFLKFDMEFEKDALVTVTRAEVYKGGRAATIFISALPAAYGARALRRLKPHLYDLQGRVNESLGRRISPRIRLALDPAGAAVSQPEMPA